MKNNYKDVKYSLTEKLLVNFFSIWLVLGLILASWSYLYNKKYVATLISQTVVSCSNEIANMLSEAPLDEFFEGKNKDEYNKYLKDIQNIAKTFHLKYLYVYVPNVRTNKLKALYGIDGETGETIKDFGLGESPDDLQLNEKVMEMYFTNGKKLILEMDNRYGHVITGYATVTDKYSHPKAVVGADVDFAKIQKKLLKGVAITFSLLFLSVSIIYLFVIAYIRKTFIKPVLLLSNKMKNFVKNDKLHYKPIKLNTNDEFNLMANSYNAMAESIQQLMKGIMDSQVETIFSIAKLVQIRDDSTGKHIERVQAYCKILAIAVMKAKIYPDIVDKKFIKNLASASPLHDIGKVAIRDIVLMNSQKLTSEEIEKMQQHTIYGEQTLAKVHAKFGNNDFIKTGMLIARSHHEKWDGTGYPDGLKGEEIPLAARIVAIADVYDALASSRVYKKAFPHTTCVKIIHDERGKHFDPQLVDIFMQIEHKFLKIRKSFAESEINSFFDEEPIK